MTTTNGRKQGRTKNNIIPTIMRRILSIIILALVVLCNDALASKAVSTKMTVTLQDGTTRIVSLRGDEYFSFFASTRGELVIRENGSWRLATEAEQMAARARQSEVIQLREAQRRATSQIVATRAFPCTGTPKALVILADFSDQAFEYTIDDIEELFNGTEVDASSGQHGYSSLAQYMYECSDGQYRPEFDIVGPYTLDGTVADYGYNQGGSDANYLNFVNDACAAADDDVDFSQYDSDGDGYVDLVYVVYAGFGENWGGNSSDCLWPKSGYSSTFDSYDGVKIFRYGMNQELAAVPEFTKNDGSHYLNGIGVLAHEFCHTLGLFDVYPTASWDDVTDYDDQSMEIWSLMDYGENNYNGFYPTPLTAFERGLFGWITIEELTEPADITLIPLQDGGKAYKIVNDADESGNEYYILESIPNGQGTGFYYRMRGNGMLVTHINYDSSAFSNFGNPNNVQGSPRYTIVPADGIIMSSYRMALDDTDENYISSDDYYADHAGDTYPGTTESGSLTDYKAYTGTMDKPLTDITQSGWEVSFKFMGGAVESGIADVNIASSTADGAAYNLAGQKLDDSYKGIAIQNGKKIIVQ